MPSEQTHSTSLAWWMNAIAKRSAETNTTLTHGAVKAAAKTMVRIAQSCEKVPDLDAIIRLHSDPTLRDAIKSIEANARRAAPGVRIHDRTNAARRVMAATS